MSPTRHYFLMPPPIHHPEVGNERSRGKERAEFHVGRKKNFLLSPQIRETPVFLPQPGATRVGEHSRPPPKGSGGPWCSWGSCSPQTPSSLWMLPGFERLRVIRKHFFFFPKNRASQGLFVGFGVMGGGDRGAPGSPQPLSVLSSPGLELPEFLAPFIFF